MCSRDRNGSTNDGWGVWGGYMEAKKQKLSEQCQSSTEKKSTIFTNVSVYVNGYTVPSSDEIKRLVVENGGIYRHYYSVTSVTHIIASNLPHSKIKQLRKEKVVKPHWIIDCVKANKQLPCEPYLLYNPDVGRLQSVLSFTSSSRETLSSADASTATSGSSVDALAPVNTVSVNGQEAASIKSPGARPGKRKSIPQVGDPNFLGEFYTNSRLHHIATWGTAMKDYVSKRKKEIDLFPGKETLKHKELEIATVSSENVKLTQNGNEKTIMHLDMDCFFVSVGLRDKPKLIGKPVAVTHSRGNMGTGSKASREGTNMEFEAEYFKNKYPGSSFSTENLDATTDGNFYSMSEIASCSYEARRVGVKNGMFMGAARKLCPNLHVIPYDFDAYQQVSHLLYDAVLEYTSEIEAVSCDEMYIDCSTLLSDTNATPVQLAETLRERIFASTRCHASAGMGPNMLVARLATRKAKPNGHCYVPADGVQDFMGGISVRDLPNVGSVTSNKVSSALDKETVTCAELQRLSIHRLQQVCGNKTGLSLHNMCRGVDDRSVCSDRERKSVSAEVNYGIRFTMLAEADKFIEGLCREVEERLHKAEVRGKHITLKLKVRHPGV